MRKMLLILTAMILVCCTACSAKQEETVDFAVPTPVIEEAEPTPTPEPVPTEKPYSEFNERLKEVDVFVSPIICWADGPYSKLYSLTAQIPRQ